MSLASSFTWQQANAAERFFACFVYNQWLTLVAQRYAFYFTFVSLMTSSEPRMITFSISCQLHFIVFDWAALFCFFVNNDGHAAIQWDLIICAVNLLSFSNGDITLPHRISILDPRSDKAVWMSCHIIWNLAMCFHLDKTLTTRLVLWNNEDKHKTQKCS